MNDKYFEVDYVAMGYMVCSIDGDWKCVIGEEASANRVCNFLNRFVNENKGDLSSNKVRKALAEVNEEIMGYRSNMNFSEVMMIDWIFRRISEKIEEKIHEM